jgi:Mrr N-terminal domain
MNIEVPMPLQSLVELRLLILLSRYLRPVEPKELYGPLADDLSLTRGQRSLKRADRDESAWHNLVQFSRRALVDEGLLDGSRRGFWSLTQRGREKAKMLTDAF